MTPVLLMGGFFDEAISKDIALLFFISFFQ